MSRTIRRIALGGVTVAALAALTACGSNTTPTTSSGKAASAKPAANAHAKYQVKATGMDMATFAGQPESDEVGIGNVDTNKWEKGTYGGEWEWRDQYDDSFTLTKIGTPDHGTATHKGNTINYTPNAGFIGDDTFTYTVKWHGQTSTGTVTVAVMDEHNDYTPSDSGSSSSSSSHSGGGGVHACVGGKHFKLCG